MSTAVDISQVAALRTVGRLLVLSEPLSRVHSPLVARLLASTELCEVTHTLHSLLGCTI